MMTATGKAGRKPSQRKLILNCGLSVGDIVMLTAAVRDLHRSYPGRFLTDVRTGCPELWENNPHLTALRDTDPGVTILDCTYPLIDEANTLPYHCLHGFVRFLNEQLGLQIQLSAFHGDIHLSSREKSWFSQVQELTGLDTPFWIICAGGKHDITIKWWDYRRYQQVADHFRGRIQFAQVGGYGHYHPKLDGVIDLRGETDLRQLVRLVYHAQGVLCGVTGLMHLAAAVETKPGGPEHRPCVVVAGGREPPHWEAYPFHQFIHNVGALACCSHGGCWRSRTVPLGDGDSGDAPDWICVDARGGLPRCMDLITAAEVAQRLDSYFAGGALPWLQRDQARAAAKGVEATRNNPFDQAPLSIQTARRAIDDFIPTLPPYPGGYRGRGIVICAGGVGLFTNAWVCIQMLRRLGCRLPIQVWHLGPGELDADMRALLAPLGVTCVDAVKMRARHPVRMLNGWELKPYAILHCPFKEVLLLDADNMPVRNPEDLFAASEYRRTGAVLWPDLRRLHRTHRIWNLLGLPPQTVREVESGQVLVNKQVCWRALRLALWLNEHSDFFYQHIHGDKETFPLAFRKLNQPFAMPTTPVRCLNRTMCQHDFEGRRLFQHRNLDKWNLFLRNKRIRGFRFEEECRAAVEDLRRRWDGRMSGHRPKPLGAAASGPLPVAEIKITVCLISCARRHALRRGTLRRLADAGCPGPVLVQLEEHHSDSQARSFTQDAYVGLQRALATEPDYVLFLEDDLDFNRHFWHNLLHWPPLRRGEVTLASFYNPGLRVLACDVPSHANVIDPQSVFGSQAFLLSRAAVRYALRHWGKEDGPPDVKLPRLLARLGRPILYHCPSLVQHVGRRSTWGGHFHEAVDFDRRWRESRE